MPDTLCAIPSSRFPAQANRCAMILRSAGARINFLIFSRAARTCTLMTSPPRFRNILGVFAILCACLALPCSILASTLEDSAKEFAQKIAAALPAKENVTYEIHNVSRLEPGEITRIDQAFLAELKEQGIVPVAASGAPTVAVTLSENFRNFVWTAEIHQGQMLSAVLLEVQRVMGARSSVSPMPVSIYGEKFWEGTERILDAGEITEGVGKSWLVLLLPGGLRIRGTQRGTESATEIISNQSASRDPWGILSFKKDGDEFGFFLAPRLCSMNLSTLKLSGCSAAGESAGNSSASQVPVMIDVAPSGAVAPGKGTEIVMRAPVCGGTNQFLATGPRDYTQTDSLQLFEMKPDGAVPISAELNFPGPVTALHASAESPRAVVKNLSTGNYEAYRLSFSCAQ